MFARTEHELRNLLTGIMSAQFSAPDQSESYSVLPLGSDSAEKGAGCSSKPNWGYHSEQEETRIQMGHERPWWVDDRADICFSSRTMVIYSRCFVFSSRLDRLLHHVRNLHGEDGRAGEGHVRLLQHPQRDHHDNGFYDHVVSVLFLWVCKLAQHVSLVFAHVSQPLHCSDILEIPHTEVVTVMDKAMTVYVRQIVGKQATA